MTTEVLGPVAPEARAAMIELYTQMSLAQNRKREIIDDLVTLDSHRATEEEAQAATEEDVAEFTRILESRNQDDTFDAYLNLGCDLIFNRFGS